MVIRCLREEIQLSVVIASDVPASSKKSNYPAAFAHMVSGREKRALGNACGLSNFGVNMTRLAPGSRSALHHQHTKQDEFIYVLAGEIVVVVGEDALTATAGMCAGFRAGGPAHHLENRSSQPAVYLEIGDRTPGDNVRYPFDDLEAVLTPTGWSFTRKDGTPYT